MQSAQAEMEEVRAKTEEIMELLNQAIEKSRSVDQIGILTKDILSISSFTDLIAINASVEASRAGEAGKGFAVVAREIRHLADSCAETAGHIQEVSEVVTGAVDYLAGSARELADYLGQAILEQLERSVQSGRQYRDDAAYIERSMEGHGRNYRRYGYEPGDCGGAAKTGGSVCELVIWTKVRLSFSEAVLFHAKRLLCGRACLRVCFKTVKTPP